MSWWANTASMLDVPLITASPDASASASGHFMTRAA